VNEGRLKELLREAPIPAERQAEERGWRLVKAAYGSRALARPRRHFARVAVAIAAAIVVLAIGLSPAGAKVADLFKQVTGVGQHKARQALTSLPAPGRLLVSSARGSWVVSEDGSMRFLGDYTDATWSPHGLFVAATRDHQLAAVAPDGTPHWSLARGRRVSAPRWAPSGYRVAYLSGASLRVVAGDGTGDRLLRARVDRVAPAWKPASAADLRAHPSGVGTHILAFATARGRVEVVDADSRSVLWRSAPGPLPTSLQWSANGTRLLALDRTGWRVFGADGRLRVDAQSRNIGTPIAAAFTPRGSRAAMVIARRGQSGAARSRVMLIQAAKTGSPGRQLLSLPGRVSAVDWSPNGHRLLLAWRDADQWLFIHPRRSASKQHIEAVASISRQFAPGAAPAGSFPRPEGWCCSP
jgi:hypothetical protein